MYQYFIVTSHGYFGGASTLKEAKDKHDSIAGEPVDKIIVFRFMSELPFAPSDREAKEDEADAYMDQYGMLYWIRCKKEKIEGSVRYAARPDGSGYRDPKGRIYICQTCGEQGFDNPAHAEDCPFKEVENG